MCSALRLPKPKTLLFTLFFITALCIGTHTRLYPLRKHTANDSQEKATLLVLTQLKAQVAQQVSKLKSPMTQVDKAALERKMFQELLNKEGERVRNTISQVATNIEAHTTGNRNYPYLLAADSFHFYNLTENIVATGSISDTYKGSKYLNRLMMAPNGFWEPMTGHPYVGYLIYKTMALFDPDVPLDYAVSYTSILLTGLSLLIFYLVAGQMKLNPAAAFVGSIFFLLSPIFIKRSTFGWYDNDPYNILFPLLIYGTFWHALIHAKDRNSSIRWGLLSAFWILLYAFFWQGWVFFFTLILISYILLMLANHFYFKKTTTRALGWQAGTFFIGSFALISICFGPKEFLQLFIEGKIALENFLAPKLSVWPDLYISVGELHKSSAGEIMTLIGGTTFFIFVGLGILFSILKSIKNNSSFHPFYTITLLIWLVASFYISLGAQRFAILAFVPMSLLCLLGIHFSSSFVSDIILKRTSEKTQRWGLWIISAAMCCLILIPIRSINQQIKSLLNPIYNAVWDKTLTQLHERTAEDAIINTWWPPGHFVKATARRKVVFDGATINHPQAYWMANIFMSQSELEAIGILRMLNSSANKAAETLIESGLKISEATNLLEKITRMDKNMAALFLTTTLKDASLANEIITLTHGTPPESYVLIFNEIVEKHIQFQFVGNWNFKAIENINAHPEIMAKVPPRNSPEYIQFLWTLVGGPYRASSALPEINRRGAHIIFDQNVQIHLDTKDCTINSPQYGKGIPKSIFYLQENKVVEKRFQNASLPYSVVFVEDNDKNVAYLMDRPLANSLLVRLHYFHGAGFNYLKPFIRETDLTRRTDIHVFKVDWAKFLRDEKRN